MRIKLIGLILFIASSLFGQKADEIVGVWWNAEKDGRVEVYKKGDQYFGKIEYIKENKNLNIFNNSLSNIIDHEWFKSKLPNSWESETPIKQCVQHCSSRIKMPDYFREHIPITPI